MFLGKYIQFLMYFLCTVQKEEDSACVLFMGTALAESPKEHHWLMSLASTNGATRCQRAQKNKPPEEKVTFGRRKTMVCI